MRRNRIHGFGVMPLDDGVATSFTLDFRPVADLTRRWRIARTGWAPAFNTLSGDAEVVSQSTTYPPSGGGDWRALYRLAVGSYSTEGLIVPWYYPLDRDDVLPPDWDGLLKVLGGDGTNLWGTTSVLSPIIWVDLLAVRRAELQEELESCGL